MKNNRLIFIYYFILLIFLISWTNLSNAPNILYRIIYTGALFLPLYKHRTLLPMVIICFYSICIYGFSFSYLSGKLYIYTFLILLGIAINRNKQRTQKNSDSGLFIILLILVTTVDFLYSFKIKNITYCILICLLFSQYLSINNTKNILKFYTIC